MNRKSTSRNLDTATSVTPTRAELHAEAPRPQPTPRRRVDGKARQRRGEAEAPPRRRLLLWVGSLSLATALGQLGRLVWRFMTPPLTHPVNQPVRVGAPASYPVGTVTFIPETPAWLGRDAGGFYALSAVCTHLGCTVHEEGKGFACPCHGSRFTRDGAVIQGPADRPLPYFAVRLEDDELMIDPNQLVTSTTRLAVS